MQIFSKPSNFPDCGEKPSHENIYYCYSKNQFNWNRRPVSVLCSGVLVLLYPSIFLVLTQDWNSCSELVGFERFWTSLLSVLLFPFFEEIEDWFWFVGLFGHFWAVLAAKPWKVWRWWWWANKSQCRDVKQVNKLLIFNLAFTWL